MSVSKKYLCDKLSLGSVFEFLVAANMLNATTLKSMYTQHIIENQLLKTTEFYKSNSVSKFCDGSFSTLFEIFHDLALLKLNSSKYKWIIIFVNVCAKISNLSIRNGAEPKHSSFCSEKRTSETFSKPTREH